MIILPHRYRVEVSLCDAPDRIALARCTRIVTAASIGLAVSCVAIVTVGGAAPKPIVSRNVTFSAVLTPDTAAAWMRAPLGIPQPHWIEGPSVPPPAPPAPAVLKATTRAACPASISRRCLRIWPRSSPSG